MKSAGIALLVTLGALTLPASRLAAQEEHEGPDFQRRRQAWFDDQRAYPNGQVDWEAIMRARVAAASQRRGSVGLSALVSGPSANWQPFGPSGFFGDSYWGSGPQLDAGRVDDIALHPTAAGTLFLATPNGGIWGTTNAGLSWTPRTDDQCTLQMSRVRIDPVNPSLMYAAASYSSGAAGCALMRSTDGGSTWASYNGNLNFTAYNGGFITALYIDPASAGTTTSTTMLFSFSGAGIYRSTNSGTTWARTLTFGYITSIVALPDKPGTLLAGVADVATQTSARSGIYRSTDNGATWTQLPSGGVDFSTAGRIELAVSPAQPHNAWVVNASLASAFQTVSRWDDDAQQLTKLTAVGIDPLASGRTNFGKQGRYDLAIGVDPVDASRIYVAGVRAFRSVDGGASFQPMATEIHCDWHTIVVDPRVPGQLYAGTDGGVFASFDGGSTWNSRNAGLVIAMYYPGVSQHPTDPNVVLGGLQDNGSLLANGTPYYNSVGGGDGGYSAINYASPSTIWSTCQWLPGPCINRRSVVNGVITWPNVTTGIVTSDRASFIPPLVMDPVTPTTLYFGTMRLYRTIDEGVTWTPISSDLTRGTGSIFSIAIAPSDALTIYVGTSDGNLQVSRDGGATFTLRITGLPNRTITHVTVDRTNAARALATFSGSGASHVFLTTDAGQTWTNITANLPDMPVNASVMIDDSPDHFLVGTDAGVYETLNAGASWTNSPGGLPNVVVHDLSYNLGTKQLVVATYGRGLFAYSYAPVPAVLRGDVNVDGAVDAFDALLTQQALVGRQLPPGLNAMPRGDTNCNARLEAADVLVTLRAAVGLSSSGACVGTVR